MNLDDAALFFGQLESWLVKAGRFKAYDIFPLNQDIFIEYSGNLLFSQTPDNWYFELNPLEEDGSELYVDRRYHGSELDNQKNVVYVRPVIAWRQQRM